MSKQSKTSYDRLRSWARAEVISLRLHERNLTSQQPLWWTWTPGAKTRSPERHCALLTLPLLHNGKRQSCLRPAR